MNERGRVGRGGGEEERRMNERNVCEGEGERNVIAV